MVQEVSTELTYAASDGFTGRYIKRIPAGRKARVTKLLGGREIVTGPKWFFGTSTVEPLEQAIIPAGEKVSYIDENGVFQPISGPTTLHVHPDGDVQSFRREVLNEQQQVLITKEDGTQEVEKGPKVILISPREVSQPFKCVSLQAHEACVVFGQDGKPRIHKGTEEPIVFIDPRERLHQFRLTGGGDDDGFGKKPGFLQFDKLRLQESQAYFALLVRTKDNTVLRLKLMIFLQITDIDKFIGRDDPFGALYNDIMARVVGDVQKRPFDEFKDQISAYVDGLCTETEKALYASYGITVPRITLRGWSAEDRQIQSYLDMAAAANTKRGVQIEEHKGALEKIEHENAELKAAGKNDALRIEAATATGRQEAARLIALHEDVSAKIKAPGVADQLLLLQVAGQNTGKGGSLHIGDDLLRTRG